MWKVENVRKLVYACLSQQWDVIQHCVLLFLYLFCYSSWIITYYITRIMLSNITSRNTFFSPFKRVLYIGYITYYVA